MGLTAPDMRSRIKRRRTSMFLAREFNDLGGEDQVLRNRSAKCGQGQTRT